MIPWCGSELTKCSATYLRSSLAKCRKTLRQMVQAQEIWSLLIPLALLVTSDRGTRSKCLSRAKTLLLAMLCLHYTYRWGRPLMSSGSQLVVTATCATSIQLQQVPARVDGPNAQALVLLPQEPHLPFPDTQRQADACSHLPHGGSLLHLQRSSAGDAARSQSLP